LPATFEQKNLRNRIAHVAYYDQLTGTPVNYSIYNNATHYSYDVMGNVKSILQDYSFLSDIDQQFKTVDYDYDILTGKVKEVKYQQGFPDSFYHKYEYDSLNRLTNVLTSNDHLTWSEDAQYFYNIHGPLKRMELGTYKSQGLDYAYTLQGWLKGINSNILEPANDIGKDGAASIPNSIFAPDEFGLSLTYYEGDYSPIETIPDYFEADFGSSGLSESPTNILNLYNGNISRMVSSVAGLSSANNDIVFFGNSYKYDQLNRLKFSTAYLSTDLSNNEWSGTGTTDYTEGLSYDMNGNITELSRYFDGHTDALSYKYFHPDYFQTTDHETNRLLAVNIPLSTSTFTDQNFSSSNLSTCNYEYDEIGNLIKDETSEIESIEWTNTGKVKRINYVLPHSPEAIDFLYNPMGNRIAKIIWNDIGLAEYEAIYYTLDAQGNILTTYNYDSNNPTDYVLSDHIM